MPRTTYVKVCVNPDCTNWLTKAQAYHSKKCNECRARSWNGFQIQSQALWEIRDRIVGLRQYSNKSRKWLLRCIHPGCDGTVTFHANMKSLYCLGHNYPAQRVPYLGAFERLQSNCSPQRQRPGRHRRSELALTLEQYQSIMHSGRCAYCGRPHGAAAYSNGPKKRSGAVGVDRVDPSRDYEAGNVVACCRDCNTEKGLHRSAADMFAGRKKPDNWDADSFEMSNGHKALLEVARVKGHGTMAAMRGKHGHFGRGCPISGDARPAYAALSAHGRDAVD